MIRSNEEAGGSAPGFGAFALMRSIDRQLAAKKIKPSAQAQQLFYDAMEAPTDKGEFELLQQALRLDPGNVDGLLAILRRWPVLLDDRIELLQKIISLAERRLGAKAFKDSAGTFWGFHETRPYMRARAELAETLRSACRIEEAIAEWEEMLQLNPNDNQGMRYGLLSAYLSLNRLDGAERLFSQFNECSLSTTFAWGRVLERWLSKDLAGARQALAVARKQNAHMEAYIKGHRRPPKHLPECYAMGSKEEAECFAGTLRELWVSHREALAWLAPECKTV